MYGFELQQNDQQQSLTIAISCFTRSLPPHLSQGLEVILRFKYHADGDVVDPCLMPQNQLSREERPPSLAWQTNWASSGSPIAASSEKGLYIEVLSGLEQEPFYGNITRAFDLDASRQRL